MRKQFGLLLFTFCSGIFSAPFPVAAGWFLTFLNAPSSASHTLGLGKTYILFPFPACCCNSFPMSPPSRPRAWQRAQVQCSLRHQGTLPASLLPSQSPPHHYHQALQIGEGQGLHRCVCCGCKQESVYRSCVCDFCPSCCWICEARCVCLF